MTSNPPFPQYVVSDRLVIRPTTWVDAPYLQQWWNDPRVTKPGGDQDGMQYDEGDMRAWFKRNVEGRSYARHFVICLRAQKGKPIGEFYIECDDRPDCITFGLAIGEVDLWGNGYATEAVRAYAEAVFASDCCSTMNVEVRRSNERAITLFESLGFEVEHVWANGRSQTMSLARDTFERRQPDLLAQSHSR